ncbi:MAG: hypothetical protein HYX23_01840 [Candidatus Zambryskibacteria bacterium]|nr:hypothetical protein [Candidatus Zambryskibacteria bacterium]
MNPEETPLKQIRTFQGDVAEALQKERGSLVSIQRAEHLKKNVSNNIQSESSRNKMESFYLLAGSLLLFVLGATGTWYGYNEFIRRTATPITTAPANRFVTIDSEVSINMADVSRETIISAVPNTVLGAASKELRHIVFTKEGAGKPDYLFSIGKFLEILGTRAPGNLVRAFDSPFMLGTFGESRFLIIKVVSFENAFAGMLTWEKDLDRDIGPLFATSEFSRNLPAESGFTDLVDKNKDIRILKAGNQTVLLYSFFDNNKLIITDNIETLRTLIDRLTREKLSR